MGELSTVLDMAKFVCEKIEKAIGVVFDPFGTKKEAVDQFIAKVKDENLSPFVEAALISSPRKYIKEYTRQNNILRLAIEELNSRKEQPNVRANLETKEVDEEWLSRFFDSAKHVSNEDLQLIWGHILANELSDPGSVPKRLISILPLIEKKHAEAFMTVCQNSLSEKSLIIPVVDISTDYWKQRNLTLDLLLDLQSLGLISYSDLGDYSYINKLSDDDTIENLFFQCSYSNHTIVIKPTNLKEHQREMELVVGSVCFTSAGLALLKAINVEFNTDSLNNIISTIKKKNPGCKITINENDK